MIRRWPGIGLMFVLTLSACQRGDVRTVPIRAGSVAEFASWRMDSEARLTPDERRELDAALQDLRMQVMARREATGHDAVEAAVCGKIHGHTFQQVLVLGAEAKLERLLPIRAQLAQAMSGNALFVVKPGDRASVDYLDSVHERQAKRLRDADAEIAAARDQLARFGQVAPAKLSDIEKPAADPSATAALSRSAAKATITDFIHEQVEFVRFKYGAWPVKFDRDGSKLAGADLEEFGRRRAESGSNGHVVVAVHLRGRWWMFDEPVGAPTFSPAVLANLTPEDRREIDDQWRLLQAEKWARGQAQDL